MHIYNQACALTHQFYIRMLHLETITATETISIAEITESSDSQ